MEADLKRRKAGGIRLAELYITPNSEIPVDFCLARGQGWREKPNDESSEVFGEME